MIASYAPLKVGVGPGDSPHTHPAQDSIDVPKQRELSSALTKRRHPKLIELDPSEVEEADLVSAAPRSLPTGTRLMEDGARGGLGEIETVNGTAYDAAIIVVDAENGKRVRKVYVQRGDHFVMERFLRGSYRLVFATGIDWQDGTEEFGRQALYYIFEKAIRLEETSDHFDHETLTLHLVPHGNVRVRPLTAPEFHALSGKTG
jgi:hypothetical protein